MSSVHIKISQQVRKTVDSIEIYKDMDQQREKIISQLIDDSRSGKTVDLVKLNQWTKKMNEYAIPNKLLPRKYVTAEMFEVYVKKLK